MAKQSKKLNEAKQAQDTEETIKNNIARQFFKNYIHNCLDRIDFTIADKKDEKRYYFWAEAKRSPESDLAVSITQLILTMGKEKTLNKVETPPSFIGAFDPVKIAFVKFHKIMHIFSQSDFNWNVTPSNHDTKEFKELYALVKHVCDDDGYYFTFKDKDNENDLKKFIADNFTMNTEVTELEVDKDNFVHVFHQWLKEVRESINYDWGKARERNVIESDFFLADLFSENNIAVKDGYVTLERNKYVIHEGVDDLGGEKEISIKFKDNQEAHKKFWKRYKRPPKEIFWDYILERRDLLVPQDVRERKGAYFTPKQWVQLSQQYIADVLGENWQDDYYVWDCAAGTGNLLAGLTNRRNLFASTDEKADVAIMKEKARDGALPLLEGNIFQFDFLNDDLNGDKVPDALKEIINDPEKRKKLVIYINPPYSETDNRKNDRSGVAKNNAIYRKYGKLISKASNELYAQFLIRIKKEIQGCILGQFSTSKTLLGANFIQFRKEFCSDLKSLFLVPSRFDNVPGEFPIGFFIWDTSTNKEITGIKKADVFNAEGEKIDYKDIFIPPDKGRINDWAKTFSKIADNDLNIGIVNYTSNDMQQQRYTAILLPGKSLGHNSKIDIYAKNLLEASIYFSVRLCIHHTCFNDKDQFFYPKDSYKDDIEFQSNCLAFTIFHSQNKISAEETTNHWIPFTENVVRPRQSFQSDFMTKFINGKYKPKEERISLLLDTGSFIPIPTAPLHFSDEAKAVFNAGCDIWCYYHQNNKGGGNTYNVNASLYDIKKFFKGRSEKGRVNPKSKDEKFNALEKTLSEKMKTLAKAIEPKVYEHGFLIK